MTPTQNPAHLKALFSDEFISGVAQIIGEKKTDPERLREYIREHSFNVHKLPPENSSILFYEGLPIGDRGNLIAITGKEKSRKTVIASAMATAIFSPNGFLGFSSKVEGDEKVLHLDTEQGYRHYYKSVKRIFDDGEIIDIPERFVSVHTRDADISLRVELITFLLEELKPAVVIIDGITDLISDINNQNEVTELGTRLLNWSYKYNCLFVLVIHITKTTGNMTGSVGTYLAKKCQTAIETELDEKENSVSHVKCKLSRDEPFKSFSVEYNRETGRYVRLAETDIKTKGKGGDKSPNAFADEVHKSILASVFMVGSQINDHEIARRIIRFCKDQTGDVLTATVVKEWIKYYAEAKVWIFRNPDNAWMRVEIATSNISTHQTGLFDATATPDENATDDLPF